MSTVLQCAAIARDSYHPGRFGSQLLSSSPDYLVQGHYLKDRTLALPGRNQFADWGTYVMRTGALTGRPDLPGVTDHPTHGSLRWHAGVLSYAIKLNNWIAAEGLPVPRRIIAHSLGAAAGQVLALRWGVPMVGFASIGVCHPNTFRGREGNVSLYIRQNDVARMGWPGYLGRLAQETYFTASGPFLSVDAHRMEAYVSLLAGTSTGHTTPPSLRHAPVPQ